VGTITELLNDVMRLPRHELFAGVPPEKRKHELPLLAPLAPYEENIKRGCILAKDGSREVHVRIFKERSGGYNEIVVFRKNDQDLVLNNGERLHINTVEELRNYVTELCSEKSI